MPARVAACTTALAHDADRVVAVLGRLLDAAHDGAGDVGAGGDDRVEADVDADDVGAAGRDGVELGVGTTSAGLLADPADQSAFLEPLHQL